MKNDSVIVGDLIKVLFEDRERMWVKVTEITDNHYVGTLRNTPFSLENYEYDQEVRIEKDVHIYEAISKDMTEKVEKEPHEKIRDMIEAMAEFQLIYPFENICIEYGFDGEKLIGDFVYNLPDDSAYGVALSFDTQHVELSEDMPQKYRYAIMGFAKANGWTLEFCLWKPHGSY